MPFVWRGEAKRSKQKAPLTVSRAMMQVNDRRTLNHVVKTRFVAFFEPGQRGQSGRCQAIQGYQAQVS